MKGREREEWGGEREEDGCIKSVSGVHEGKASATWGGGRGG